MDTKEIMETWERIERLRSEIELLARRINERHLPGFDVPTPVLAGDLEAKAGELKRLLLSMFQPEDVE